MLLLHLVWVVTLRCLHRGSRGRQRGNPCPRGAPWAWPWPHLDWASDVTPLLLSPRLFCCLLLCLPAGHSCPCRCRVRDRFLCCLVSVVDCFCFCSRYPFLLLLLLLRLLLLLLLLPLPFAATPAACAGAELPLFVVISPPRPCPLLERVRMLTTLTQGCSKCVGVLLLSLALVSRTGWHADMLRCCGGLDFVQRACVAPVWSIPDYVVGRIPHSALGSVGVVPHSCIRSPPATTSRSGRSVITSGSACGGSVV